MYLGLTQKEILEKKQKTVSSLVEQIQSNLEQHKPYYGQQLLSLFKNHNESWINYVDSTCRVVGAMTGAGGSWPSFYSLECETNMNDQRLFTLTNTLQCIKRNTKNNRNYEIPACLYQSYTVAY